MEDKQMQALRVNRKNGHSARRLRWTRGGLSLFSLIIVLSLVLAAPGGGALAAGPTVQAQDGTVLPGDAPGAGCDHGCL